MTNNKSIVLISILIVSIVGYFAFFSGEKKKKRVESKKLSLLLGGGGRGSEDGESASEKRRGRRNNNSSLFESDFMKSGISYQEEESTAANGEQGEIPINPQTGKPWEEDAMQQFDELRKLFADNDLIPRRMSREDKAKQAQLEERWNKAQNAVNSGTYTRDDLDTHFNHQKKVIEDRLQIIEYLIEAQKEDGEVDKDGQFQKILDGTKDQMKQLEAQREDLAKKLGG
ncbi:MAG TPA: hypothetical protein PK079_18910 [Leptospiraceae bacterium]|nr:hypothetical protein [Leptospiraceae bacterium]HMW07260.1 hypothetical protein [Leptospiraceae bacterium]HMX34213.1 hypothetical protein [Leptospiraceae bacterium]HMY32922.1 hypothetical protein [Leptospiraceae bacterium]HMZ66065.1 hypothetical protein [Leptospiraceae bacterium]